MKTCFSTNRERGLTFVELLVVTVVVGFLTFVILGESYSAHSNVKERALRIQCAMNLKQTGLAFRIWEADHGNSYPMAVSKTNGGSMEFIAGMNEFRHFEVISNELSTPKILLCPAEADRGRFVATDFSVLGNSNLSYFLGIVPNETNAMMLLSGDRNITNGIAIKNGLLALTTNTLAGWTTELHKKIGNIGLADGSVQQESMTGLRYQISNTGVATNRVQMPVLGQ